MQFSPWDHHGQGEALIIESLAGKSVSKKFVNLGGLVKRNFSDINLVVGEPRAAASFFLHPHNLARRKAFFCQDGFDSVNLSLIFQSMRAMGTNHIEVCSSRTLLVHSMSVT